MMDGHIKTGTTANKKRASATPVFPIPYPFFDSASRAGRLPRWIQRKTCGHKSMSAPFPIYTCERQFAFALQKTTPNPQLRMLIHIIPTKTTSPIVACNARKNKKKHAYTGQRKRRRATPSSTSWLLTTKIEPTSWNSSYSVTSPMYTSLFSISCIVCLFLHALGSAIGR